MASLPDLPKVEIAVVERTNAARTAAKLHPLVMNQHLAKAARAYADLLARTGTFLHDADASPAARVERAGYTPCSVSENLALRRDAQGFETASLAKSAVDGWLASPMHRRNLLAPASRDVGVGVARMPDLAPKYVVVQMMGQTGGVSLKVKNAAGGPVHVRFAGTARTVAANTTLTLHACDADAVIIETAGPKPVSARYAAEDGATYVVSGTAGQLRVDFQHKR